MKKGAAFKAAPFFEQTCNDPFYWTDRLIEYSQKQKH